MNFEKVFPTFRRDKPDQESQSSLLAKIEDENFFKTELLSEKEKNKLAKLIKSGEITDFANDGHKISEVIGREAYSRMHWSSLEANRNKRRETGKERMLELQSKGKDREPFILKDGTISLINVHGHGEENVEEVNQSLPKDLDRFVIDVDYREKESSNNEIDNNYVPNKITRTYDSSGKMNNNFLKEIFNKNKASFIMMGGNLRGCFFESLRGVVQASEKNESAKVDFHIPLDKCYDDDVYEKINGYKNIHDAISKLMHREESEIYNNNQLVEATGEKDHLDSKFRFYLWDDYKVMSDEINSQSDLAKVRESFKDLSAKGE